MTANHSMKEWPSTVTTKMVNLKVCQKEYVCGKSWWEAFRHSSKNPVCVPPIAKFPYQVLPLVLQWLESSAHPLKSLKPTCMGRTLFFYANVIATFLQNPATKNKDAASCHHATKQFIELVLPVVTSKPWLIGLESELAPPTALPCQESNHPDLLVARHPRFLVEL